MLSDVSVLFLCLAVYILCWGVEGVELGVSGVDLEALFEAEGFLEAVLHNLELDKEDWFFVWKNIMIKIMDKMLLEKIEIGLNWYNVYIKHKHIYLGDKEINNLI